MQGKVIVVTGGRIGAAQAAYTGHWAGDGD